LDLATGTVGTSTGPLKFELVVGSGYLLSKLEQTQQSVEKYLNATTFLVNPPHNVVCPL